VDILQQIYHSNLFWIRIRTKINIIMLSQSNAACVCMAVPINMWDQLQVALWEQPLTDKFSVMKNNSLAIDKFSVLKH
jgi:hypothetical protein